MPRELLIPQHGSDVKTYGVNYNKIHTMRSTSICLSVFIFHFYCVFAEIEFYPDFRRPDPVLKWENDQAAEEYALEQFTNYLQEQQRRLAAQRDPEPDFTYRARLPLDETPQFAVPPSDPRYFDAEPSSKIEDEEDDFDPNFSPYEPPNQEQPSYQQSRSNLDLVNQESPYYPQNQESPYYQQYQYQPQAPAEQNPESLETNRIEENFPSSESNSLKEANTPTEEDNIILKTRTDGSNNHKLLESDLIRIANGYKHRIDHNVDITPLQSSLEDDSAGVYIIAVVAGISAAATVALIAFAIGWYNLQKNVKNASDVEYPAYGVTGPNKDVSPTGDRRLAQSAQMYHYQHQKQQIIAMESRAGATVRHGSMSEAESDEENEEGDYTVYECPGLAPTGEMEVKNPLFQDDPTPASQAPKDEESLPDQK